MDRLYCSLRSWKSNCLSLFPSGGDLLSKHREKGHGERIVEDPYQAHLY